MDQWFSDASRSSTPDGGTMGGVAELLLPQHPMRVLVSTLLVLVLALWALAVPGSAWADRDRNSFDGNIFALYAGDGALVPPRNDLGETLEQHRAAVLAFYLDDSADCKRFASVLSQLRSEFGGVMELIAVSTDSLVPASEAAADQPDHYWRGRIPQVVVLDGQGRIVLDEEGQVPLETIEQSLVKITGLEIPAALLNRRTESREVNEINMEVTRPS